MKKRGRAKAPPPALPFRQPPIEGGRVAAGGAVRPPLRRAPHAVVCANGTAALHLAAIALNLEPGSTVIVPAVTFVATANAARYQGARVVFADVDARTGLMTPENLEAALAQAGRTHAVFP